ncbi:MAG: CBS domain-containing protein [Thaumarchaeota archaeon]|nr:CBS domain-containing protein [Nitrososphaerota archaeon]
MLDLLKSKAGDFMNPDLQTSSGRVSVADAAKKMASEKLDSMLVLDDEITGIVTTADILEKVVAVGKDSSSIILDDIKSQPVRSIHKDASVLEAIRSMNQHDIRRLLIKDGEKPIGMITRKQIVGDMGKNSIVLPELEEPHQIRCPYCESSFSEKNILSKHIDEIHIGKGLLEGNLSQR